MNYIDCVLILTIILLLWAQREGFDAGSSNIKPAGFAANFYMDHYKYMVIQESQLPMTLFEAVNTFHTGDILYVQCNMKGNDCPPFKDPYGTNNVVGSGQCRKQVESIEYTWVPVAKIISVMLIENAFPVMVLDRAVEISGRRLGVGSTPESQKYWDTTIFPDPIKTPFTEIMSLSRWQIY